jgi:hypothetical protein
LETRLKLSSGRKRALLNGGGADDDNEGNEDDDDEELEDGHEDTGACNGCADYGQCRAWQGNMLCFRCLLWNCGGREASKGSSVLVRGTTEPRLRVKQLTGIESGTFACKVTNVFGMATSEEIHVKVVPRYEWLGRALFVGDFRSILDLYCGKHDGSNGGGCCCVDGAKQRRRRRRQLRHRRRQRELAEQERVGKAARRRAAKEVERQSAEGNKQRLAKKEAMEKERQERIALQVQMQERAEQLRLLTPPSEAEVLLRQEKKKQQLAQEILHKKQGKGKGKMGFSSRFDVTSTPELNMRKIQSVGHRSLLQKIRKGKPAGNGKPKAINVKSARSATKRTLLSGLGKSLSFRRVSGASDPPSSGRKLSAEGRSRNRKLSQGGLISKKNSRKSSLSGNNRVQPSATGSAAAVVGAGKGAAKVRGSSALPLRVEYSEAMQDQSRKANLERAQAMAKSHQEKTRKMIEEELDRESKEYAFLRSDQGQHQLQHQGHQAGVTHTPVVEIATGRAVSSAQPYYGEKVHIEFQKLVADAAWNAAMAAFAAASEATGVRREDRGAVGGDGKVWFSWVRGAGASGAANRVAVAAAYAASAMADQMSRRVAVAIGSAGWEWAHRYTSRLDAESATKLAVQRQKMRKLKAASAAVMAVSMGASKRKKRGVTVSGGNDSLPSSPHLRRRPTERRHSFGGADLAARAAEARVMAEKAEAATPSTPGSRSRSGSMSKRQSGLRKSSLGKLHSSQGSPTREAVNRRRSTGSNRLTELGGTGADTPTRKRSGTLRDPAIQKYHQRRALTAATSATATPTDSASPPSRVSGGADENGVAGSAAMATLDTISKASQQLEGLQHLRRKSAQGGAARRPSLSASIAIAAVEGGRRARRRPSVSISPRSRSGSASRRESQSSSKSNSRKNSRSASPIPQFTRERSTTGAPSMAHADNAAPTKFTAHGAILVQPKSINPTHAFLQDANAGTMVSVPAGFTTAELYGAALTGDEKARMFRASYRVTRLSRAVMSHGYGAIAQNILAGTSLEKGAARHGKVTKVNSHAVQPLGKSRGVATGTVALGLFERLASISTEHLQAALHFEMYQLNVLRQAYEQHQRLWAANRAGEWGCAYCSSCSSESFAPHAL